MDVRCINSKSMDERGELFPDLTENNIYPVIGLEGDYYRIIGDLGKPFLYHKNRFKILNGEPEKDWVTKMDNGCKISYPEKFLEDNFFRDYFNGDIKTRNRLHSYAQSLLLKRHEEKIFFSYYEDKSK